LGEFIYSFQAEASICVVDVAERHPFMIFLEEEKEKTLGSALELIIIFSQEAEQEMTTTLEPAAEHEVDNMEFFELYKELEALERKVNIQIRNIQQVKLETDGEEFQYGEQLEEFGVVPAIELTKVNLSEETVEQQISEETVESEYAG
jgi:hypothetical protein